MPSYNFDTSPNSYFAGHDLVAGDDDIPGLKIRINEKDGMLAVEVKDRAILADYPAAVQGAVELIGDKRTQELYEKAQQDFWDCAQNDASQYGFTAYSAGRSSGWLAVDGTQHLDARSLMEPDEEDTELRDKFLKFAFEQVNAIEHFRTEFYKSVLDAAAEPAKTQIMVLADGSTFSSLEGCKVIEVPADLDTESIEALLAERPSIAGLPMSIPTAALGPDDDYECCPNCDMRVDPLHPAHSTGCVLGGLLAVIEDRGEVDFSEADLGFVNASELWDRLGPIVDDLERRLRGK